MLLSLVLVLPALAAETADPELAGPAVAIPAPNLGQAARYNRGRRTYKRGMALGAAGLVALTAAAATQATASEGCRFGTCPEREVGTYVALTFGIVAIELGAPIALAGARQSCSAAAQTLEVRDRHGSCSTADVGWGLFAGQVALPGIGFGFVPLSYVAAALQNRRNKRSFPVLPTPAVAVAPDGSTHVVLSGTF